jgi:hypothetical protein
MNRDFETHFPLEFLTPRFYYLPVGKLTNGLRSGLAHVGGGRTSFGFDKNK